MGRLQDKVAVITGGGGGIGRTTAVLLASEGAMVVVTDIDRENGFKTVDRIKQEGGKAFFIEHDVTEEKQWVHVVQETLNTFGTIDVLFNNAGIYIIKPVASITLDEWNHLMAVNVTGVFLGLKHVLPVMATRRSGSVINASSVAGLVGFPGDTLYGASKGAVRILTKAAAAEYAPYRIRINSIHPGYVRTGMAEYAAASAQKTLDELAAACPMGRLAEPLDIAQVVLFLASDESSYITASEFVIDGGATFCF
ncbi:MAG TPA: glucose 1-dehydrogenase [Alicyclobacillus sp.]|nr:glucose 1-dehydrogenase [Alicyclobacillus sp.]